MTDESTTPSAQEIANKEAETLTASYREIDPHMRHEDLHAMLDYFQSMLARILASNLLDAQGKNEAVANAQALMRKAIDRADLTTLERDVLMKERDALGDRLDNAKREAGAAQDALADLKGRHAELIFENARLLGYLDAIDPMVDVPTPPPPQMTRRRYVQTSNERAPADRRRDPFESLQRALSGRRDGIASTRWWDLGRGQ